MGADTEMLLYKRLGVGIFKKIVLALEKWRRKGSGYNSNYHLYELSYTGVSEHIAFLSYNAFIHFISFVISVIVAALRYRKNGICDLPFWVMVIASIINIYCILLQRYNALRIEQLTHTLMKRRKERIESGAIRMCALIPEDYAESLRGKDMEWVEELVGAVRQKRDFFIEEEDACIMERLADWVEYSGVARHRASAQAKKQNTEERERLFHSDARLNSGAERRVQRLQRVFLRPEDRTFRSWSVVTAGPDSEKAFDRLFLSDKIEAILETAETILQARSFQSYS